MQVVWFMTTLQPLNKVYTLLIAEIQSESQLRARFMHRADETLSLPLIPYGKNS